MEFRFELSNGYSYEDMLMLCRAYVRKSPARRWLDRLCRLCLILLGGAWILSALSWLDGGYVGETPLWVLVALPMFIGLLLLALGLFWDRLTAWVSRRRNLQNLGHICVCLNEDNVVVETKRGQKFVLIARLQKPVPTKNTGCCFWISAMPRFYPALP